MKKLWWVMVVGLGACGGSSSTPDAATPDARIIDAMPVDAGPCNTIANVASDVAEMAVADVAPTPGGGTIVDGTYVVTAATIYTGVGGQSGATGATYRSTSVDQAGQYTYLDDGTTPPVVTAGQYVTTSATADITIVQQCPPSGVLGFKKYTASPTEFTLFDVTNPAAVHALTFTLQ